MSDPIRNSVKLGSIGVALDSISTLFEQSDLYMGHGTDNAWDEALFLILTLMGLPLDSDRSVLSRKISDEDSEKIINAVIRGVIDKEPLPYILNQAWFMGMPFYVDPRVLIPRSPFAELIRSGFSPWVQGDVNTILEIGTGSGCMSIAAATVFTEATIDACDVDTQALSVASKNVRHYQLGDRVTLIHSDVFSGVTGRYDIIMSNPPYVGVEEMRTLPEEYSHEPVSALEASDNGLGIVDRIIKQASDYLNDNGVLFVEVGNSMDLVQQVYRHLPLIWLNFESGGHGVFMITKKELNMLGGYSE